jgi:hypothetical protein
MSSTRAREGLIHGIVRYGERDGCGVFATTATMGCEDCAPALVLALEEEASIPALDELARRPAAVLATGSSLRCFPRDMGAHPKSC